ncbi:hypothetical protein H0H93_005822 [Arthromyces matolae]|nr:hypothetical protein H0H93_005822 [Arthromyces matolae]
MKVSINSTSALSSVLDLLPEPETPGEYGFGGTQANLSGSAAGLFAAYHLDRHYRYRREIEQLYLPLETHYSDVEDLENEAETQLLPTHTTQSMPEHSQYKSPRLADVWDEREEVFGIGSDDEENSHTQHQAAPPGSIPKITVSES